MKEIKSNKKCHAFALLFDNYSFYFLYMNQNYVYLTFNLTKFVNKSVYDNYKRIKFEIKNNNKKYINCDISLNSTKLLKYLLKVC